MHLAGTFRITALALMLLAASGCSIKMLYNNADRFARWAVNDYIQMTDEQEAYFVAEADALHYWHRTRELPLYADYLESLPAKIDREVDEDGIQEIFDTLYGWWEVVEAKTLPMVTEMLLSLTDEQVARLPERLAEDNEKWSEDESGKSLEEVQESWQKEYGDTMSRFSGRLSREQKAYLEAQSVRYIPQFELWAEYRNRWQGDLLVLLHEKRRDPEQFAEAFAVLSEDRERYYGEELTAVFDANEALATEITAWLLNNLTDRQRERFQEKLGELATAFRELAAEAPEEIPEGGGCLVRC